MHEKCEKSGELSLVTKAKAVRRRAEEKQQKVYRSAGQGDSRASPCHEAVTNQ